MGVIAHTPGKPPRAEGVLRVRKTLDILLGRILYSVQKRCSPSPALNRYLDTQQSGMQACLCFSKGCEHRLLTVNAAWCRHISPPLE